MDELSDFMGKKEYRREVLHSLSPNVRTRIPEIEKIVMNRGTDRSEKDIFESFKKTNPLFFQENDPEEIQRVIQMVFEKYQTPKTEHTERLYYQDGSYRFGETLRDFYSMGGKIKTLLDQGPENWKADEVEEFLSALIISGGLEPVEAFGIMNGLNCGTWIGYPSEFKEKIPYILHKQREREKRGPDAVSAVELNRSVGMGLVYSRLADEFLMRWPAIVLEGSGEIRLYREGIYPEMRNPHKVKTLMLKLSNEYGLELTPANLRNAEEMLKVKCTVVDPDGMEDFHKLPVKNGVLDIITKEFLPHTPDNVYFSKLPVAYEPSAKPPEMFLKAISKSLVDQKKIDFLQEIFGYCLYRSYSFRAIFFLLGNGDNGKAVFLNILEAMLGKENVCNLSPKTIASPRNDHTLMSLFGKMANIDGEAGKTQIKESENLKKLSGRDTIEARHLWEKPIRFKNYAKLIFALNKLPEVDDFSEGFKSRIYILNFSRKIPKSEQIEGLEDKIIESGELPGILNWSLEGLNRVLKNHGFTYEQSSADRGLEYDKKSNPVSYFIEEEIEEEKGGWLLNIELYNAYREYAGREGLPELNRKEFRRDFIRECGEVGIETFEKQKRYKAIVDGKEISGKGRGFVNVALSKKEEGYNGRQDGIEDPDEHDMEDKRRFMMDTLNDYLKTEYRTKGGIEVPEETAAGFLVRYPAFQKISDLKEITGYVERAKEGFFLPH